MSEINSPLKNKARYDADVALPPVPPLSDGFCRDIFHDGSAVVWRDGVLHLLLYPPTSVNPCYYIQYTDNINSRNLEWDIVCEANCFYRAQRYVLDIIRYIRGPGSYRYRIVYSPRTRNKDLKRPLAAWSYHSPCCFKESWHDSSFFGLKK